MFWEHKCLPWLTISLTEKKKGEENLNLNVPPFTHMLIHLLPKDASGSIKIPDPFA